MESIKLSSKYNLPPLIDKVEYKIIENHIALIVNGIMVSHSSDVSIFESIKKYRDIDVRIDDIDLKLIACKCGNISIDDLEYQGRKKSAPLCRWLVWEYQRINKGYPLEKCGMSFKNKLKDEAWTGFDHVTVIHGLKKLNDGEVFKGARKQICDSFYAAIYLKENELLKELINEKQNMQT